MKNLFITILITALTLSVNAQKSIDALFERYAGKDGFVTLTINGNLLRIAKVFCDNDEDDQEWSADITTIRILAQEDGNRDAVNFYDMLERELDKRNYEEFMRIKEHEQDLVMLVRTSGRSFKEFLFVAGGEDNVVIQIKGNMTFEEAERFSDKVTKDNGADIIKK